MQNSKKYNIIFNYRFIFFRVYTQKIIKFKTFELEKQKNVG